jgi:pimeloyl-ACP methyl ester carboxylesterase
MPVFENGPVRIHYEEAGTGFPMLVLPGGGLDARIDGMSGPGSFNPLVEFADTHRCVAMDLRNADGGGSSGPLEVGRPWDAFTDDQLELMDHLEIEEFIVTGFCISGPMIWNLIRRAPGRVVAAILAHPSGFRPELPDRFYRNNMANWAPRLLERRPDITQDMVERYLRTMYPVDPEFMYTVSRDFVRDCETPILIMPDDSPPHPFAAAMETARLARNAQVCLYPWREPSGHIELALTHARTFLKACTPLT